MLAPSRMLGVTHPRAHEARRLSTRHNTATPHQGLPARRRETAKQRVDRTPTRCAKETKTTPQVASRCGWRTRTRHAQHGDTSTRLRHWPPSPCCPEDELVAPKGSAVDSVVKVQATSSVRGAPQVRETTNQNRRKLRNLRLYDTRW